ncbi:MAG: chemotaxis protein CheW [Rhodospirillaceae bacterium]|nr:chemotaxis protein CheW [Rhodospirillaceae bacterium]MBL6942565.1 chemotaxis protein CheW [Rhodospirillales bacterium]
MNQALATTSGHDINAIGGDNLENFVTFTIKDQLFGIPVLQVQDILTPTTIASVPLAPPEVKGSINLRGRIVTVIDVRVRLGLGKQENPRDSMGVTIEHKHELYTLLVDKVGDVIGLASDLHESNPGTLDSLWREFASGVFRLEGKLMVVLDVERLLGSMREE